MNITQTQAEIPNWWIYVVDSTTLIIGLLTLLIAFKIFNRFSFKNKVLEKQFETVSDLIHTLQNFTISIHSKGHKIPKESKNHEELFFDEKLLFTQNWFEQNPLIGLDNNPFMPKNIAYKLQSFKIWLPLKANAEQFDKVTYIDLDEFDPKVNRNSNGTNLICNPKELCFQHFETFYMICKELNEEIEEWLKKYDANNLNLK